MICEMKDERGMCNAMIDEEVTRSLCRNSGSGLSPDGGDA